MPTARDNHDAHDCAERIRERFVALLSQTCDGKSGPTIFWLTPKIVSWHHVGKFG